MVIRPLKILSDAIAQFGASAKSEDIHFTDKAPREITQIFASFKDMAVHIEEAQHREEEISRMKSDFISTAAHQLRTPLTGIRWTLEALEKEEAIPADKKSMLQDALKKNKQLVSIVRTLLDVSAIEAGHYTYHFAQVNLTNAIRSVIDTLKEHAHRRNVTVSFIEPQFTPMARADGDRIQWVLTNLIENAIRYTPEGGKVTVWIEQVGDTLFISVHDTGIGIPPEERGNIFERFFRGKKASALQNEGNGLGLYIARNIVRDHKGDLQFRANEDGPGTTFYFSLPPYKRLE